MNNFNERVKQFMSPKNKEELIASNEIKIKGRIRNFTAIGYTDTSKIRCKLEIDWNDLSFLRKQVGAILCEKCIESDNEMEYINLTVKHRTRFVDYKSGKQLPNDISEEFEPAIDRESANDANKCLQGLCGEMNYFYNNHFVEVSVKVYVFKKKVQSKNKRRSNGTYKTAEQSAINVSIIPNLVIVHLKEDELSDPRDNL